MTRSQDDTAPVALDSGNLPEALFTSCMDEAIRISMANELVRIAVGLLALAKRGLEDRHAMLAQMLTQRSVLRDPMIQWHVLSLQYIDPRDEQFDPRIETLCRTIQGIRGRQKEEVIQALAPNLVVDTHAFREVLDATPTHTQVREVANKTSLSELADAVEFVRARDAYGYLSDAALRRVVGFRHPEYSGFSFDTLPGVAFVRVEEPHHEMVEHVVHEAGHCRFAMLTQLFPPIRKDKVELRVRVPWRNDSRPVIGVLHGIYVWLRVVRFWQDCDEAPADARTRIGRYLEFIVKPLDEVRSSGALTAYGDVIANALVKERQSLSERS